MKSFSLLLTFCVLLFGANAQNMQSIAVGSSLPSAKVKMKDVTGKEITLGEAKKENGLLVMFSCNTCPYVIRNQERTKEICKYAESKGLGVVLINSNETSRDDADSYEAMKAYAKAQNYTWPYTVDANSEIANAFGASRTPEVYVFDKNDKLVYKGAIDDNPGDADAVKRQHLKLAIDATVEGKEVAVKESRSVGCGIKRPS
jgi:peroxiredoxin